MIHPAYFFFNVILVLFFSCQPRENKLNNPELENSMITSAKIDESKYDLFKTFSPSLLLTSQFNPTSSSVIPAGYPIVWYYFDIPTVLLFNLITVDKKRKVLSISPMLPPNIEKATTEKLMVGSNEFEIFYEKSGDEIILHIEQSQPDWRINVQYPKGKFTKWIIKGEDNRRSSTDTTEGFSTVGRVISYTIK